jgi:hypothetical protein
MGCVVQVMLGNCPFAYGRTGMRMRAPWALETLALRPGAYASFVCE